MKKFLLVLFFLMAIAATVFVFGYINFWIDTDKVCVLVSKLSGVHKQIIYPGKFYWTWENIFPTNVTLYQFRLESRDLKLKYANSLPSAELYASFLPAAPDFNIKVDVAINFILKEEKLPFLLQDEGLYPDKMEDWYKQLEEKIKQKTHENLLQRFSRKTDKSEMPDNQELKELLEISLKVDFPSIDLNSLLITEYHYPDMAIYQAGKEIYQEKVAIEKKALLQSAAADAVQSKKNSEFIEKMDQWGKIITRYPLLIELFKTENGTRKLLEDSEQGQ